MTSWSIAVDDRHTTAQYAPACGPRRGVIVLAHGAGGHMNHPHMVELTDVLCGCGLDVVRFDFLYRAVGSGPPDRMPMLTRCFEAVVTHAQAALPPGRLLLGGHSLGGRVASVMVADGCACAGLILFSYPLHPAGRPERLRSAHLPAVTCPVLAISGTRDALCTPELMRTAIEGLPTWTHHWVDGGDHALAVLKRSGRTRAEVLAEISQVVGAWLS